MSRIPYSSEDEWLQLRKGRIGSTDVAALFGISSWATPFILYHAKRGHHELPFEMNDRVEAGKRLEPVIAQWAADKMNWTAHPTDFYVTCDDTEGMGCSLDWYVNDPERGDGLIEVKNRDWMIWKDRWVDEKVDPEVYMQVQAQFACTGWTWGIVACLVGGNDLKLYPVEPNAEIIAEIKARVNAFWAMDAPDPSGTTPEFKLLQKIYPEIETEVIECDDLALMEEIRIMDWANEQKKGHERAVKTIKPKMLGAIKNAEMMIMPGITVFQNITKNGRRLFKIKENGRQPAVPETTPLEG